MLVVSYYNLNNEVFAICSEGNNVKMQIVSKENGHVEVTHTNYVFDQVYFRHQHLTHLLLTFDILHRASRAYHNFTVLYIPSFKICSALRVQIILL